MNEKACANCKLVKPVREFWKDQSRPDGLCTSCIDCKKSKRVQPKHSPEGWRKHWLKKQYKMTVEDYEQLLFRQGGVCRICGTPPGKRRLAIDHNHKCCPEFPICGECVRGLLCYSCNSGLGNFKDDDVLVDRAVRYLRCELE